MSKLFDLKVDVVSKKNGETFLASKSIPSMPPTLCGSITLHQATIVHTMEIDLNHATCPQRKRM